jgi:hypothetical protein
MTVCESDLMQGGRRTAAAALLVATCLVGCSSQATPSAVEILGVFGDPDSARLDLVAGSCHEVAELSVAESDDEVRLTATLVKDLEYGPDCGADATAVRLESLLGERIVVDEFTGERIEVLPPGE